MAAWYRSRASHEFLPTLTSDDENGYDTMGDDKARRLILARRARFIAATLASVAATTAAIGASAEACGGATEQTDGGGGGGDAKPQPCLKRPNQDTSEPQPCLTKPYDPEDASDDDAATKQDADLDADPRPCLTPPLPDE